MKVEKTNVHRLSVERECGCRAVREFKDQQYKDAIAEAIYSPCKKHKAKPELQDMMAGIMVEDVNREAENQSASVVHRHSIPTATTTTLDGSSGETVTSTPITRPRPRVAAVPVAGGGGGTPLPANGPRRDPMKVSTVSRDHNVGRRATAASRRPNTVQVGEVELGTPGFDIDIDMEGVPEDPRVTRLAEEALLPELEDDHTQA